MIVYPHYHGPSLNEAKDNLDKCLLFIIDECEWPFHICNDNTNLRMISEKYEISVSSIIQANSLLYPDMNIKSKFQKYAAIALPIYIDEENDENIVSKKEIPNSLKVEVDSVSSLDDVQTLQTQKYKTPPHAQETQQYKKCEIQECKKIMSSDLTHGQIVEIDVKTIPGKIILSHSIAIPTDVINTRIRKMFDNKIYKGSVVSVDTELKTNRIMYKVAYEDGDTEDMYIEEVIYNKY